jgi:thiol-disulfide isomerase/thioredoxin
VNKPLRLAVALLLPSLASAAIIKDVRDAIAEEQFGKGEALIQQYRASRGVTPEMLEALSWLGRGALKLKQFDKAEGYARQTHELALAQLKKQKLDDERHLPIALGAAIEVQSHVFAARNQVDQGVAFLQKELKTYYSTSIRTRIQKNIHLLSLEGKPAPVIPVAKYLGPQPKTLAALKGSPVILFFWAHWCGDCKYQGPILANLQAQYKSLVVLGPTQHYGYVARETRYIDEVRQKAYASLPNMPVPLDDEVFKNYGCSTTPTLVLIDRAGIVRMYHPGVMKEEELKPLLDRYAR